MFHDELHHKKQPQALVQSVGQVLMVLALGAASTQAMAEQYCKTVDKSGAATYTLATAKGCNKKAKSVAVSHAQPVVASKPVANADAPTADTKSTAAGNSAASAPAATTAAPAGQNNMLTVPPVTPAPPAAR